MELLLIYCIVMLANQNSAFAFIQNTTTCHPDETYLNPYGRCVF